MEHSDEITKDGERFARLLRLVLKTWRVQIEGKQYFDQYYENGRRSLVGFWHGKYVPIFPLLEGNEACIITSLSTRGSIIGEICRSFGYKNAQVPDEPRLDAFRQLLKDMDGITVNATAFDGPLGPYHVVKPGLVRLSSMLGLDIVPLAVYSRPNLKMFKRWDKLEVPMPFGKICLVFGEPLTIPSHLHREELERISKELEERMEELEKQAMIAIGRKRSK